MWHRLVPQPLLTVTLTALWLMLNSTVSPGMALFGLLIGLAIPQLTARYWPGRPRPRHPVKVAAYIALVLWDIAKSNVTVATAILFRRNASLTPAWIVIPLDLTTPEAITLLAGTITMTPGTVSADLSADGRCLLVHCLDAPDPDAVRAEIKHRYERRLKEIFE